jgi:hypothetical protein
MNTRFPGLLVACLAAMTFPACSSKSTETTGSGGAGGGGAGGASTTTLATTGSDSTGSVSTGSASTGSVSTGSASTSTGSGSDPYEAAREACVGKINALRATKGLPAFARWKEAELCVDQQATEDETTGKAHGAWSSGKYPCNGSGQNECLGAGVAGVEGCLDSMWAEKDQAGCAGCDACADAYNPSCPGCDFYGQATGDVCGHYINMSAKYFTKVACGFSAKGGWDAMNFQ